MYDLHAGLGLTKTAELATPFSGEWPRVAAGDVDGDGVDEIGLAFIHDDYWRYQVLWAELDDQDRAVLGQNR